MAFSLVVFPTAASSTPLETQLYLIPIRISTAFNHNRRLIGRRLSQLREPLGARKVSHHWSQFTNFFTRSRSSTGKRSAQPGGILQYCNGSLVIGVFGRCRTASGSLIFMARRHNCLFTHHGTGGNLRSKRSKRRSNSGALVSRLTPFQPASSVSSTPAQ